MDNNSTLTFLLVIGSIGTIYFLAVGAKAIFKLIGLMIQVLAVALLVGFTFAYLSRKVDNIDRRMEQPKWQEERYKTNDNRNEEQLRTENGEKVRSI